MIKVLRVICYLPWSVYFNFHYLPIKQAVCLPILLYKPRLLKVKGSVKILGGGVRTGMVHLGFPNANIYPNNGIMWENHGGTVIFNGKCFIGNDTYLSFGHKTVVEFGDKFVNEAAMKLVSGRGIKFGTDVTLGWGCMIMDTNFHPLYDMVNEVLKPASGEILIGDDNWFGAECRIMHSVITPDHCTFGIGTIITRGGEKKSYCVMAGSPMKVIAENVRRHPQFRTEEY